MNSDFTLTGKVVLLLFLGLLVLTIIILMIYKRHLNKVITDELKDKYKIRSTVQYITSRSKYPEVDVLRNTNFIFNYSLATVIAFTLCAFSYTQYDYVVDLEYSVAVFDDDEIEVMPRTKIPPPEVLPPPPQPEIVEVDTEDIIEEPVFIDMDIERDAKVSPATAVVTKGPFLDEEPPILPVVVEEEAPVFRVVQQMPRFPGCEEIAGSDDDKKNCADKKMLDYIYGNLKYPAIARENRVEGMAVIRFIVNEDGSVIEIELVKDPGAGLGAAALAIVEKMSEIPQKWTPGKQGGKNVKVLYTLPIKFKLKG